MQNAHENDPDKMLRGNGDDTSPARIIMWTLMFQLAWHFRAIIPFIQQGTYQDPDDFLRLNQVRNWMSGHGWFDVSVPRMNLPDGGDMHWSRLVDVPIAGLIWFFDLFVETQLAERLASIAWPTILLIITVFVLIGVCRKLFPQTNSLLALLFIVTCIAALVEFAPARIDHHNVQILLFSLTLLGLVNADGKWGHYLIGMSIACSIVIGLDVILLLVFILGWLGLEWVLGLDENGKGLIKTALAITGTSLILYPISVAPANWLVENCDAISIVYLAGLVLISAAFVLMAATTNLLQFQSKLTTILARMAFGGVLAIAAMGALYSLYPQCSAGPLSGISEEMKTEWLSQVVEAKGLIAYIIEDEAGWIGMPIGLLLVISLGLYLLIKNKAEPRLLAILATVVIVFALGFVQVRAYRIGMFAIVPICVIIAQSSWIYFSERYKDAKIMAVAATGLVCAMLMTPTWLVIGGALASVTGNGPDTQIAVASNAKSALPQIDPEKTCKAKDEYAFLGSLPKGYVLNSIDLGPAMLVFTQHSVVGGNYHRNGEAILDTRRFFSSERSVAHEIIKRRKPDYVAFCHFPLPETLSAEDQAKFGVKLMQGNVPAWLEKLSPEGESLLVFKYLSDV